ncbi:MAG: S41 family peptidase [Candidatus Cloacimonetes bacterium]|nr:S41 family peptidase [Candidatus Cloacimonadota bacterium]
MKTKLKYTIMVIILAWVLTIFVSNNISAFSEKKEEKDVYENLQLISDVLFRIKEFYVEEIDIDTLTEAAIKGMVKELDPHTHFFNRQDFLDFKTDTDGEFGGLGINIEKLDDFITVISPMDDSPAQKAGIIAGDKIVEVNKESIEGMAIDEVIKMMRGPKGTRIEVGVQRKDVDDILYFSIIRDNIKVKSVPYVFRFDNGIGYIRVNKFSRNTANEFSEALDMLEDQGIRGLLIDMRFNPGGLLDQAVDMVNEFIGKDKKVVYTKGKNPSANQEFYTSIPRIRTGYPIVVLINELSASAAEIFSGSIQDWDKGLVVGQTTFGKGSVQQIFPLSGENGIKITISKYYIHSGRSIHRDQSAQEDSTEYFTDMGRKVRGGGGITPDITIEQRKLTEFERRIINNNLLLKFALDVLAPRLNSVDYEYEINESDFNDFLIYLENNDIDLDVEITEEAKDYINKQISAEIIGNKLNKELRYKKIIESDTQLQKSLELFDNFNSLPEMFSYLESLNKSE